MTEPGIVIVSGLYFEEMVKYVVERVRELTYAAIGPGEPLA